MRPIASCPAHADTRTRAVVPQQCPRLSDIPPQASTRSVLVPHPARRQASSTSEKGPRWLSRPALYSFSIFVSYRSGRTHVSSFTRIGGSGRLKIRRCSRSWLYVARQSWVRGAFVTNYGLSHCFWKFQSLVLIQSAAVWRFCRALVGGKRE